MGDTNIATAAPRRAPQPQYADMARSGQEYGDTLGVGRPVSGVARSSDDPAELARSDSRYRPGPVPEELEEIPDVEHDASLWTDAEPAGSGAPNRRTR